MTVGDMIRKALLDGGYDGLVEYDSECSCDLDDLMPCDSDFSLECTAGKKKNCDCDQGCNFHIVAS